MHSYLCILVHLHVLELICALTYTCASLCTLMYLGTGACVLLHSHVLVYSFALVYSYALFVLAHLCTSTLLSTCSLLVLSSHVSVMIIHRRIFTSAKANFDECQRQLSQVSLLTFMSVKANFH